MGTGCTETKAPDVARATIVAQKNDPPAEADGSLWSLEWDISGRRMGHVLIGIGTCPIPSCGRIAWLGT